MFVLIPHESSGNLYVYELAKAYERLGHQVILGRENLLYLSGKVDVLHVHWPEALFRISYESKDESVVLNRIISRVNELKASGTKIVFTVHNLAPHEKGSEENARKCYMSIWRSADVVVHHCKRSVQIWNDFYRIGDEKRIIVCPHGHYFGYGAAPSKLECRKYIGVDDDAFLFLFFGLIRAYKGLYNVLKSYSRANVKNKRLLVVGRWVRPRGRNALLAWAFWKRYYALRGVHWHLRKVANDEVRYFVGASDAVVLGHVRGLNSGVAVLGMTYGKPVVGPDIGCIGEVLREGMNVVYRPGDVTALSRAMEQAARMDPVKVATVNQTVARRWSWDEMARAIVEALG